MANFDIPSPTLDSGAVVHDIRGQRAGGEEVADAIKMAAGTARSAVIGKEQAEIEQNTQLEVDNFLLREEVLTGKVDPAVQDYQAKLDRVKVSAKSALELAARVEVLTTRHINRFPGLSKDFIKTKDEVLGRNSAQIRFAEEELDDVGESESDIVDVLLPIAARNGLLINPNGSSRSKEEWMPDLYYVQSAIRTTNELASEDAADTATRHRAWSQMGDQLTAGYNAEAIASINSIFEEGGDDDLDVETKLIAAKSQLLSAINKHGRGAEDLPQFEATVQGITELFDTSIANASSESAASEALARNNIYFQNAKTAMLKDPDLAQFLLLADTLGPESISAIMLRDPQQTAIFFDRIGQMVRDVSTSFSEEGVKSLGKVMDEAVRNMDDPENAELVRKFTMNFATPDAHSWKAYLSTASNENLMALGPEEWSVLRERTADFAAGTVVPQIYDRYDPNTMRIEKIQGGMQFVSTAANSRSDVRVLNNTYATFMNQIIKIHTHMHGSTDYTEWTDNIVGLIESAAGQENRAETSTMTYDALSTADRTIDRTTRNIPRIFVE